MSLFRAKTWWSTRVGTDEEFDTASLQVGFLETNADKANVVIGSLQGILRVLAPSGGDYTVEDLLVEQDLGEPILGLLLGRFVPAGEDLVGIAVLHPRKLAVYTLDASAGTPSLSLAYSHTFQTNSGSFTACNMTSGPFGGDPSRDHILVQSMDGRVACYEQDAHSFTRRLLNCLVPGPIVYVARTDSFVTATSTLCLESYRYQVLAGAQDDPSGPVDGAAADVPVASASSPGRRASVTQRKMVATDWSVCLGEQVIDIKIGKFTTPGATQVDVLAVGASCLFGVSESGDIKMQKKLDFDPAAMTLFDNPRGDTAHNMILTSFDDSMYIFRRQQMVWSAKLTSSPVAVFVADYEHRGMVTTLDDSGLLSVVYLGTDPAVSGAIVPEAKEIDYDDVDEEHRKLLGIIRASQSDARMEPRDKIIMRAQVPRVPEAPGALEDLDFHDHVLQKCVRQDNGMLQLTVKLFLTYTGSGSLSDVSVTLDVPECALVKEKAFSVSSLKGGTATPMIIDIVFYANAFVLPNSNEVSVQAMFLTGTGEPRASSCKFELPMFFSTRLIPPIKEPAFKFKLDTNKPPVMLATLFDDMVYVSGGEPEIENSSNYVLSFRYWVEDETQVPLNATILLSKNAGRYRVQSNYLPALWFVGNELCKRLKKYFEATGGSDFDMWYDEPHLPLQDFYNCIDEHFSARVRLNETKSLLNDCAQQFRTIEKRLLVRFKDRNAVPLQQLDVVMAETYHRLMGLADDVGNTQILLGTLSNNLSCVTSLVLILIKLKFKLDEESFRVLKAHLSPVVNDNEKVGWEEATDAAMTYLLRTVLAKKGGGEGGAVGALELQMPADTTKLKKHISIVADRLGKGAVLAGGEGGGGGGEEKGGE